MFPQQRGYGGTGAAIGDVDHIEIGRAPELLESDVQCRCRPDARQRQHAGAGARRVEKVGEHAIRRCTVDDDERGRTHEMADRLEALERIVVQLSHVGADNQIWRVDEQGIAVGRGARHGLGSDHGARSCAILDHDRRRLRAADLVRHQAGQDVAAPARCKRNDDLDRSRRLRPGAPGRSLQRRWRGGPQTRRHRQPAAVAEIASEVSLPPLITAGFAAALTLVATPAGLEPATFSLEGCCSIR